MDTVCVNFDDIERVLDWSVRYEKDRVMITTVLNSLELYFNPCSGTVEDVTERRHLVCVPDINILSVAEDLQRSIRLFGMRFSRDTQTTTLMPSYPS